RRKGAAVFLQLVAGRLVGIAAREHAALSWNAIAFLQIAALAGRDHVAPLRAAATRTGDHMVEGQLRRRQSVAAILAGKTIAQENIEPCKGWPSRGLNVFLQTDHRRQTHLESRRPDDAVILRYDVDAIEEDGLDRLLPRPERQWEIAERPKIRVQHQCWAIFGRQKSGYSPPFALSGAGSAAPLCQKNRVRWSRVQYVAPFLAAPCSMQRHCPDEISPEIQKLSQPVQLRDKLTTIGPAPPTYRQSSAAGAESSRFCRWRAISSSSRPTIAKPSM